MPESYDVKLNRRLRTRAIFPAALQNVPIRYVDTIAALDTRQQELLTEAMASGRSVRQTLPRLKRLGEAATLEMLLREEGAQPFEKEDVETLADILDECFPGMPASSAAALAESPVMAEALRIVADLRAALESQNFNSDFVVVALYAVIKYVKRTIEDRIQANPAFIQTLQLSGLVWEGSKAI